LTRLIPTDGSWPKSFARKKLNYDITIRARFGTTVCALVKAGLGIAVIDQFTVAHGGFPGIELLRIVEPTKFDTYLAETRRAAVSLHRTFYPLLAFGNAGRWARSNWATEGCLAGLQKMVCYVTGTSAQFRSRIVYLDTSFDTASLIRLSPKVAISKSATIPA
jgi:hypothetical protein